MDKLKIALQFKNDLSTSKRGLSPQYSNTRQCQAFYDKGDMDYKDTVQFYDPSGRKKKALVKFNKIKPNVDAVAGFMAQNRRKIKYMARLTSQLTPLFTKYMNAISDYVRDNTGADHIETEQDLDMLVVGYGATETDMSYILGNATTTPNGEIIKVKLDPRCVGWDPHARAKNLMDRRYNWYYEDYDLKDAVELFQDENKEHYESVSSDSKEDYEYNPYGGVYDKIKIEDSVEWAAKQEDLVRVYNYQWFEYQTFYKAKNPLYTLENPDAVLIAQAKLDVILSKQDYGEFGGDMFDFDPSKEEITFDEKTKRLLKEEFGNLIEPVPFTRKCFYTAIISGNHVFKVFKSVSQQQFSVQFKTGTFNNTEKIWVGMVNSMMDPQKYYNKALTELLFTIAANSKGGVMVEESAVEDITDFESKWAKTDATIIVSDGALSGGKIQEKGRPQVPTGLEGFVTLSDAAIADTSGVDPAFLGSRENHDESGILYKRRIRQIISTMARYMDSITYYAKTDARIMADFIRVWVENNNGELVMITGEEGIEEFVEISQDKLVSEYAVTMQEAPLTPEDDHETAAALSQIGDKYLSVGDAQTAKTFHAQSIQMLNIDRDVKQKLAQALQPQEGQIDPQQFMMMQQELQKLQSIIQSGETRKTMSDAALNEARAQETMAKTTETLEKAANQGLENDLIRTGSYSDAKVSI